MRASCDYTAGEDYALDERLVRYDVAPRSRTRACCTRRACSARPTSRRSAPGSARSPTSTRAGCGTSSSPTRTGRRRSSGASLRASAPAGGRIHLGRSRNDQVLTALRLYLRDAVEELATAAQSACAAALEALAAREAHTALPGLHAHAAGDAELGAAVGAAASPRSCATTPHGLRQRAAAPGQEPAGLGGRLRHPGTAARSRGDARGARVRRGPGAGDRSAAVARQGRGAAAVRDRAADAGPRRASPPTCCCSTPQEFGFVALPRGLHHRLLDHAAEAQPGRVRADPRPQRPPRRRVSPRRSAMCAKLPSGYQRDLQLLKVAAVPRHRRRRRRRSPSCRPP